MKHTQLTEAHTVKEETHNTQRHIHTERHRHTERDTHTERDMHTLREGMHTLTHTSDTY